MKWLWYPGWSIKSMWRRVYWRDTEFTGWPTSPTKFFLFRYRFFEVVNRWLVTVDVDVRKMKNCSKHIATMAASGKKYPNFSQDGTFQVTQNRQLYQKSLLFNREKVSQNIKQSQRVDKQYNHDEIHQTFCPLKNSGKCWINCPYYGNR